MKTLSQERDGGEGREGGKEWDGRRKKEKVDVPQSRMQAKLMEAAL